MARSAETLGSTGAPGSAETDADLARAAALGNHEAFDELYRRHADAAWRTAYAVTGNRDDAADAVAEAFTRILTAFSSGRLQDLEAFRPYLLTATRNAGIDALRRSGRLRPMGDELTDGGNTEHRPGPSERLVDNVDAALVAAAFRSLPERWRSVLWLTEVEGMGPAEAAPLLGVSANGAAQLAVRARAGLRQRFLQAHLRTDVAPECRYTVERLGAYVGGGLAPRDIAKVDQHLAGCEECRARRDDLDELGSGLRGVAAALPLSLGALVWTHFRRAAESSHRGRGALPLVTQRGLMGASLGMLAIGIIGASIIGQPAIGSISHSPGSAAGVPVGQNPVALQERAAAAGPVGSSLPLALGGSAAGTPAAGTGAGTGRPTSSHVGTAGGGAGTTPSAPGGPSLPVNVSGVSPGSGSGSQVQLSSSLNLSPAPVSGAATAGTGSAAVSTSTPSGTQSATVSGTAPTAPTTSSTGTPSASVSLTSPLGSQTLEFPSSSTTTTTAATSGSLPLLP